MRPVHVEGCHGRHSLLSAEQGILITRGNYCKNSRKIEEKREITGNSFLALMETKSGRADGKALIEDWQRCAQDG
jgi:hypothetical protein